MLAWFVGQPRAWEGRRRRVGADRGTVEVAEGAQGVLDVVPGDDLRRCRHVAQWISYAGNDDGGPRGEHLRFPTARAGRRGRPPPAWTLHTRLGSTAPPALLAQGERHSIDVHTAKLTRIELVPVVAIVDPIVGLPAAMTRHAREIAILIPQES